MNKKDFNHTQNYYYCRFSALCLGEPDETFTHSHQSWSSIILHLFPPSITIHGILPVQFTCLTDLLHNLCPSFLWFISWYGNLHCILHTFLHPIIVFFLQHMPKPSQLFCCSTEIISSNPSLSLNSLLGTLDFNSTHPSDHSHLCPLKCHLIFFSYRPGLTSMQHTISHTTAVQSLSRYQWYIFIGKQWYQVPEFFPSNSNSGLRSCISISIYTQHVT